MAKFRLSSHTLRIEAGRHERPKLPAENRLCTLCNINLVEDEFHFVFICDLYTNERNDLLDVCNEIIPEFETMNDTVRFCEIMRCKIPEVIKALCKYVLVCFIKCKDTSNMSMVHSSSILLA